MCLLLDYYHNKWNLLNMQRITISSKRWDYSDTHGGEKIKGPAHMVESTTLQKRPTPTHYGRTSVSQWEKVLHV